MPAFGERFDRAACAAEVGIEALDIEIDPDAEGAEVPAAPAEIVEGVDDRIDVARGRVLPVEHRKVVQALGLGGVALDEVAAAIERARWYGMNSPKMIRTMEKTSRLGRLPMGIVSSNPTVESVIAVMYAHCSKLCS